LQFAPMLPAAWQGYHCHVAYCGARVRIDVTAQGVCLTLEQGAPLRVRLYGTAVRLQKNRPVRRALR